MTSKKITITAETYGVLKLIKNQILSKFNALMDESQIEEVVATSHLNGELIPYAYIFIPEGEENQKIAKESNSKIIPAIFSGDIISCLYKLFSL